MIGNIEDDPKFGFVASAAGRSRKDHRVAQWQAMLIERGDSGLQLNVAGQLGPTWEADHLVLSVTAGPGLQVMAPKDAKQQLLELDVPMSTVALEWSASERWFARASATAALQATTDTGDLIPNMTWSATSHGYLGVGYQHAPVSVDLLINPEWVYSGPYLLSGTSRSMFGLLSLRATL